MASNVVYIGIFCVLFSLIRLMDQKIEAMGIEFMFDHSQKVPFV